MGTPSKRPMTPWLALGFVWDLLLIIAVPTILCALGGRWLDQKFGVSPLFLFIGLVVALGLTYWGVMRKARDFKKLW
jgi:F0F1-type ATP synthase assembly protein I